MPTKQSSEQRRDLDRHQRDTKDALIGEQLIHALGEPEDLLQIQVRMLWPGHYRVNVLVGPDTASVRVADSYFIHADTDGNILASTPRVTRRYGVAPPSMPAGPSA